MKETDLAYMAGIVDGEGCIYGHLANRKQNVAGNIDIRVTIQAVSMAMILKAKAICEELGLTPSYAFNKIFKLSKRPAHRVDIMRKQDVQVFLQAVLPYLIVKRREAEMVLEWYENWGNDMRKGPRVLHLAQPHEDRLLFLEKLRAAKRVA